MLADVSQSIPDAGGGISGFVAHGLWCIYRHFPSSGRYDYLLLFVSLMVLARLAFLPYVLKVLKRDVARLRKGDSEKGTFHPLVGMFWDTVGIWWLVWFFYTDAGKTFLVARTWFGQELTEPGLFGDSLFCWFLVTALPCGVAVVVTVFPSRQKTPKANPRWFLYVDAGLGSFAFIAMMILAAHLLYWYWSRATILLFWSYFVAVVLTEIIRVSAIYILLRRPEDSVRPD